MLLTNVVLLFKSQNSGCVRLMAIVYNTRGQEQGSDICPHSGKCIHFLVGLTTPGFVCIPVAKNTLRPS